MQRSPAGHERHARGDTTSSAWHGVVNVRASFVYHSRSRSVATGRRCRGPLSCPQHCRGSAHTLCYCSLCVTSLVRRTAAGYRHVAAPSCNLHAGRTTPAQDHNTVFGTPRRHRAGGLLCLIPMCEQTQRAQRATVLLVSRDLLAWRWLSQLSAQAHGDLHWSLCPDPDSRVSHRRMLPTQNPSPPPIS